MVNNRAIYEHAVKQSLSTVFVGSFPNAGEPCADLELYQCLSGQCINDFMVCNNIKECDDSSDERKDLCGVVGTHSKPDVSERYSIYVGYITSYRKNKDDGIVSCRWTLLRLCGFPMPCTVQGV